jgi:hypothetical protein
MEMRESEWAKQGRAVHTYTLPDSLRGSLPNMPKKVGLVQLTAEQELMASKIGKFDVMKSQYAATKLSIVEFDGRPVNQGEAEVDKFWERVDSRVRALLLQAYNKLSSPSKEEEDGFFSSETVQV